MVSKVASAPGCWQFVLRPNCSATPGQIRGFFAAVACVSLTIAVGFAAIGFWPILPFAGAELVFLWVCLHCTAARARDTEVIRIDADIVAVERGRSAPQHRWTFHRAWARINLEPPRLRLHPSRLLLGSHGRKVLVGAFLTEEERRSLAHDLRSAIATRG